jgi:hypothetical protein
LFKFSQNLKTHRFGIRALYVALQLVDVLLLLVPQGQQNFFVDRLDIFRKPEDKRIEGY